MVILLAIASCALWGSAFAFVKLGYELFEIGSAEPAQQLLFAGMRFSFAGLMVLVATTLVRRKALIPSREELSQIGLLALAQTGFQYALFYIGLAHASGTNASLVQGTSAFIQILLATLVFRQEKMTMRKLLGSALGIIGVALVTLRGGGMTGEWSLVGEGLVLASVVAGGTASCLMRNFGKKGDPLLLTGWQFLLGGASLSVVALLLGGRIGAVSPPAIGVLAYLAALSASAFSMWSSLLKYNPVSRVAMFRFFIPLFGVLFSTLFLGEVLPHEQLILVAVALGLIATGTIVVNSES
ncbi:MAG: DMT family transporter [Atopobiaceae bacterium]|nr:DMT family transporter [Atopobiaceae bacterium]